MTYVVKQDKAYIKFDRFVRGMSIITTMEPVVNIIVATEFETENSAKSILKEADSCGFDITKCVIHDRDEIDKQDQERAKAEALAIQKNAWENTSEKRKREMLREILDNNGQEAVDKFLKEVGDTSGIQPAEPAENDNLSILDKIYQNMEKILGRPLTESEKEDLTKGV